jgi:hypothetical protein
VSWVVALRTKFDTPFLFGVLVIPQHQHKPLESLVPNIFLEDSGAATRQVPRQCFLHLLLAKLVSLFLVLSSVGSVLVPFFTFSVVCIQPDCCLLQLIVLKPIPTNNKIVAANHSVPFLVGSISIP